MFIFTSPKSVNISEVFVYLLPIRSFPDSPKYRADPVIGSGLGLPKTIENSSYSLLITTEFIENPSLEYQCRT